jgi:predicted permease
MLGKNPGFSIVAVLTLALGIGANTAIFSIVDSLLLRPLPVKDPQQLAVLAFRQSHGPLRVETSIADFRDISDQTTTAFSAVSAYQLSLDGLSVNGKSADRIVTNYVPGNFFSMLGLQPQLGRLFLASEGDTAGANPVIVLSHAYWKTHFAGDPRIVGGKVDVNGHPMTVVGVTPPSFHGIYAFVDIQAYLPLGMLTIEGSSDFMINRQMRNLNVLGRLRPGTTFSQAQAVLSVVAGRLARQYPNDDKELSIEAYPELRARPNPDPKNQLAIIGSLFLGLAILVLLLACANVTNILLVRATVREREMAIRSALGAARISLIRQLMTESIILALAGGLAGILLGSWASSALGSIQLATDLPVRLDFGLDWRVFGYAFAAALLTGVVVGIFPALRASRSNLNEVLHQSGRGVVTGKNRFRNVLVMAQVGGSLMLLIVAGLFTRSLGAVQAKDIGFDPRHLLNASMDPAQIGYNEAQGRAFYENLLNRVRALPASSRRARRTPSPWVITPTQTTSPSKATNPPPANPHLISSIT